MKTSGQQMIQRLYTDAVWVVMHPYVSPNQQELNVFPGEAHRHQTWLHHIRSQLDPVSSVIVVHDTYISGDKQKDPAEDFADYPRAHTRKELVKHIQHTGKTELVYTGFHWGWCLHRNACGLGALSKRYRCYALRHCCAYTAEDSSTLFNTRRINRMVQEEFGDCYVEI